MRRFLQRIFLVAVAVGVAACSGTPSMDGLFGNSNGISLKESTKSNPNSPLLKYGVRIHIVRYADGRNTTNPRKIGTGGENVTGMGSKDILLDQDAAALVTGAMRKRLDDAGFQVSEADSDDTNFELSGVIKDLTYNVKYRDEVSISVETTLKEKASGKIIWSGIVVEKNDRFAGVSGNDKSDVANYLKKELGIVTSKTTEAITAVLTAVHPELFNLTPGTRPIPGVTVLVAPTQAAPSPMTMQPGQYEGNLSAPAPAATAHATASTGLLLVNTNPQRAKVYVDDVYYGLSPLRVEMDPGVHAISVKLEGYRMVTEKVSVRKGDNTEMQLDLQR